MLPLLFFSSALSIFGGCYTSEARPPPKEGSETFVALGQRRFADPYTA